MATSKTTRITLTNERIRKLEAPVDRARYVFDGETKHLAVRVTPAGAKSFCYCGKLDGVPLRITIGSVDEWPLGSVWEGQGNDRREVRQGARERAKELQALIDKKIDPRHAEADQRAATERRQAEAEAKRTAAAQAAPALVAWSAYVESRSTERRRGKVIWGALSLRDHDRVAQEGGEPITRGQRDGRTTTQPGVLRPLLSRPLPEITAERVHAWLRAEVAERPAHAALAYRLLCAFLRWAAARKEYSGQVDTAVCTAKDVRDQLPKPGEKKDSLQREQLKAWFAAVEKLPNPTHRVYLQALLLTGARRNELAGLRWVDVDFVWGSITIHDKVDGERTIPLTPYVASLLRELKARNEIPPKAPRRLRPSDAPAPEPRKPSPWVFSSARAKSGRLQEPRIAHQRALAAAGLPPVTLHGLRRSFGSLPDWFDIPVGVVPQIMGHKPSATTERHYRVRPLDLLRAWHTRIEAWILNEAGIEQPGQVAAPRLQVVQA